MSWNNGQGPKVTERSALSGNSALDSNKGQGTVYLTGNICQGQFTRTGTTVREQSRKRRTN